jgi:hypothetical protein
MENALEQSIGLFHYKPKLNETFETQDIKDKKKALDSMDPSNPAFTQTARELRSLLVERRYELFHEENEKLGDPQFDASFLKMVKCKNKRSTTSGSKLDPGKVNEYVQHFESTFGGQPAGQDVSKDPDKLESLDTSVPLLPRVALEFTELELDQVLDYLPLGKAPGVDGIAAEAFKYGRSLIAPRLLRIFRLLSSLRVIPTEWTQSMVHPVYKNKGSAEEIINYRPIALTVVCRRLYERMLLPHLEPFVQLLEDTQGGFRRNRSTHQHAFYMNEVIKKTLKMQPMLFST